VLEGFKYFRSIQTLMPDIIVFDAFTIFDRKRYIETGKMFPLYNIENPIKKLIDEEHILYAVGDEKHTRLKASLEMHDLNRYFRKIFGIHKDGKDKFDFIWYLNRKNNDDRYNWWDSGNLVKRVFYITDSIQDLDTTKKMGVPTIGIGKNTLLYENIMKNRGALGVIKSIDEISDIVYTIPKY
jgi:phosphoglycolate phosphatase-like HAD superfamily hydrolase